MREMYVTTCSGRDAAGRELVLDYYILIDQMELQGGFACESYGVMLVEQTGKGERVSIPNLTVSVARIDALMELLTRNFVTTATVGDVVDDWL